MKRMSRVATAVAALLLTAGLSAQGKPDFSGKWTLVPDPNAAAPAGGGGGGGGRGGGRGGGGGGQLCGQECTITQDATTLTITRTTQAGETKAAYKLDGSESKNMQAGRGGQTEVVSKAAWDGNKVSITSSQPGREGGPAISRKAVISVTGGTLEIENTVDAGQGPQTTKQTYKKG
jgi:hypothetical protein